MAGIGGSVPDQPERYCCRDRVHWQRVASISGDPPSWTTNAPSDSESSAVRIVGGGLSGANRTGEDSER